MSCTRLDSTCAQLDTASQPLRRVYAMSDIHGDQKVFMDCLMMTGVARWNQERANYDWIAGPEVEVVIIGDVVDGARCATVDPFGKATEKTLLYLIGYFQNMSIEKNGRNGLIYCVGNHELYNLFPFRLDFIEKVELGTEYFKQLSKHYNTYSKFVHVTELESEITSERGTKIKNDILRSRNFLNVKSEPLWRKYERFLEAMATTVSREEIVVPNLLLILNTIFRSNTFDLDAFLRSKLFLYLLRLDSYNTVNSAFDVPRIKKLDDLSELNSIQKQVTYGTLLLAFCSTTVVHKWDNDKVWFVHGGITAVSEIEYETTTLASNAKKPTSCLTFDLNTMFKQWDNYCRSNTLNTRMFGHLLETAGAKGACDVLHELDTDMRELVVGHCPQLCSMIHSQLFQSEVLQKCLGSYTMFPGEFLGAEIRVINHHLYGNAPDRVAVRQGFVKKDSGDNGKEQDCVDALKDRCGTNAHNHIGVNGTLCGSGDSTVRIWRVDSGSSMAFTKEPPETTIADARAMSIRRSAVLQITAVPLNTKYEHAVWTLATIIDPVKYTVPIVLE